MSRTHPILGMVVFLACASPALSAPMIYDKVVAVVGKTPILLSEVRRKVLSGPLVTVSAFPSSQNDVLFDQALHDAINMALIEDEALDQGLEVLDEELEDRINQITQRERATREQLISFLKEQGLSFDDYKEDMRKQLLVQKFKGRVLAPRIRITKRSVEDHYHITYQSSPEDTRLHLWQVIVPGKDTLPWIKAWYDEHSKGELTWEGLKKRAQSSQSSDLWSQVQISSLGVLHVSDLADTIQKAFVELEAGNLSQPVSLDGKWRLFYIEKKESSLKPHFVAQKDELEWELRNKQLSKVLEEWLVVKRKQYPLSVIP